MDNGFDPYGSDPETIRKEALKAVKIDRTQLMADLNEVLQSAAGRRVLWNIVARCGIFQCAFTGNSSGYFLEGRQEVGKWLFTAVQSANLALWRKAEDEHLKKEKTNG